MSHLSVICQKLQDYIELSSKLFFECNHLLLLFNSKQPHVKVVVNHFGQLFLI